MARTMILAAGACLSVAACHSGKPTNHQAVRLGGTDESYGYVVGKQATESQEEIDSWHYDIMKAFAQVRPLRPRVIAAIADGKVTKEEFNHIYAANQKLIDEENETDLKAQVADAEQR